VTKTPWGSGPSLAAAGSEAPWVRPGLRRLSSVAVKGRNGTRQLFVNAGDFACNVAWICFEITGFTRAMARSAL
jgi:hypothetical protein